MFITPSKLVVARKVHNCSNCGELILIGEKYSTWKSVDDSWSTSKMHQECLESLQEDDEWEYTLYGGERPKT